MLLDVSCTVKDFLDFIDSAPDVRPDFDMEGRDKYNGFGLTGEKPSEEIIDEEGEIYDDIDDINNDDPVDINADVEEDNNNEVGNE